MTSDPIPLAPQRCANCGSTQLRQDTDGVWHCEFCRSTFRADDPAMIVVDSPKVQEANENVVDTADLLTYDQEQAVSAHLHALRDRSDVVTVVETVNTITENVEHYARRRAQELGIGDDAKDNGLYILLVRSPRRVQVQTGNGIAPYLGAEDLDRIVSESIVPRLKAGDLVAGLTEGADALVAAYQDNRATGTTRTPTTFSSTRTISTSRSFSRPWRSLSDESRGAGSGRSSGPGGGSTLKTVLILVFVAIALWMVFTSRGGLLGGGGGGDYTDSGYDSGYDSGGGSDFGDFGGGGDYGGSDYGGGDFDSGSGGGSDW